jgi:hypothetical protein
LRTKTFARPRVSVADAVVVVADAAVVEAFDDRRPKRRFGVASLTTCRVVAENGW